jgi:8-oxo-dGTP diphosphatase
MSIKFDSANPYTAAYVILRKDNKVAFVLRGNLPYMPHHFGLPAGKVEKAERFIDAAIREAKEETGVTISPENLTLALIMQRIEAQEDGSMMEWVDAYFESERWEGEPHNAEPHMHDALEWLDPKNLPKNTVPAVAAALKAIEDGKTFSDYGWN